MVVLVEGAGFTLDFAGGRSQALTEPGAAAVFQGDEQVFCRLHAGPCRDLSLMVRTPGTVLAVQLVDPTVRFALPGAVGARRAVYPVLPAGPNLCSSVLPRPSATYCSSRANACCWTIPMGRAALAPTDVESRALLLEWDALSEPQPPRPSDLVLSGVASFLPTTARRCAELILGRGGR